MNPNYHQLLLSQQLQRAWERGPRAGGSTPSLLGSGQSHFGTTVLDVGLPTWAELLSGLSVH